MIQVPDALLARFEVLPCGKKYFRKSSYSLKKRLRFCLEFCSQFCRDANKAVSLADFLQKLLKKRQMERQQKQAAPAISLYLEVGQASASDRPSVSS